MHRLTEFGLFLAIVIILTNRFVIEIPSAPAVILYTLAVLLFTLGLYKTTNKKHGETSKCIRKPILY